MQVNDPPPELTIELVSAILGRDDVASIEVAPLGRDRALLSTIDAVTITYTDGTATDAVAKRAAADADGAAVIAASGAYRRELDLYERFLTTAPLPVASLLGIHDPEAALTGNGWVLLLERVRGDEPDQLVGLSEAEATLVLDHLAVLHRTCADTEAPIGARRHPMAGHRQRLETVWPVFSGAFGELVGPEVLELLHRLIERTDELSGMLGDPAWATMTHADPRADNLIFADDGGVVFLDWQQAAWQHPAADLAWLAATSLATIDAAVVERLARHHLELLGVTDMDPMAWFRRGLTWPLSQFMLLAARPATEERRRLLVHTSISRITTAAWVSGYDADEF